MLWEYGVSDLLLHMFNLRVLFMSEGRVEHEIYRRNGAVMWTLYWSVMVKRELRGKRKLSIYQSIYVPILTCGHELWVVIKRMKL